MASAPRSIPTALDTLVDKEMMIKIKMELGNEWLDFAERLLPSPEFDAIKHDPNLVGMKEMDFQALTKWTQKGANQATVRNLVVHLHVINRRLANQIKEMAIRKSVLFEDTNSIDIFLAITNATNDNWKFLAEGLLSVEDVKAIERISSACGRKDMLFQCLKLWQNKHKKTPIIPTVLTFLEEKGAIDKMEHLVTSIAEVPLPPEDVADRPARYNMNFKKRGLAIIFNQKNFDNYPEKVRRGTDVDRDELENTFLHLGFDKEDILKRDDFTTEQIESELERVSKRVDHSDHACLVVAILSHGRHDYVATKNEAEMPTETLWEPFHGINCPTLAGKPKIFLIQACRGSEENPAMPLYSDDQIDAVFYPSKIPQYFTDLLIVYSTPPGFVSIRNVDSGSWFIQTLCKELKVNGSKEDLQTILTAMNNEVTKRESNHGQQIPGYTSFLRKQIVFSPKKSSTWD